MLYYICCYIFAKHDRASSYVVMRQCLYRNSIPIYYQFLFSLKLFEGLQSSKFQIANIFSNLFERRCSDFFTIFCWMINYNMLLHTYLNCCKLNKTTLHSWLATAFTTSLYLICVEDCKVWSIFLITKLFQEQEWK